MNREWHDQHPNLRTGWAGKKTKTMLRNPLLVGKLVQADIGRAKPSAWPHVPDQVHGVTTPYGETAAMLMREHRGAETRAMIPTGRDKIRDMKKLNVLAVSQGRVNARELYELMKEKAKDPATHLHDIDAGAAPDSRIHTKRAPMGRKLPSAADPNFAYGTPTPASEGVKALLSTEHADRLIDRLARDEEKRVAKEAARPDPKRETRGQAARREAIKEAGKPPPPEDLSKLEEFLHVESRLFRAPERYKPPPRPAAEGGPGGPEPGGRWPEEGLGGGGAPAERRPRPATAAAPASRAAVHAPWATAAAAERTPEARSAAKTRAISAWLESARGPAPSPYI
eukprot:tig00020610_g12005.t1